MVTTHKSYINTTRVPWCKRHRAEGNWDSSRGHTTALLKESFAFSSWPSTYPLTSPEKMWQGSATPESMGLERRLRREVLPRSVRDDAPWCFAHTLPYWLSSSPWFTLTIFQSGGLGNDLFPDIDACCIQVLYSLSEWELFYLWSRNPQPKVYKKDWVFQKLPLSEHRWYQDLSTLQQNPYLLFPPPSYLIFTP